MKLWRDTMTIFSHQLIATMRAPMWLVLGIIQPLVYLGLFTPVLRGALGVETMAAAYDMFVPGLLVLLLTGASAYSGVSLINEVRSGAIARCRLTVVSRTALLLGRVLRDVVSYLTQAILVIAVAAAFGMRVDPVGLLVTLGLLALMAATLSAVSYGLALNASNEGSMSGMIQLLSMPVLMLSGIMIPLSYAPAWLQTIAGANPLYYLVSGSRALFDGDLGGQTSQTAVYVVVGTSVVGLAFARQRFVSRMS